MQRIPMKKDDTVTVILNRRGKSDKKTIGTAAKHGMDMTIAIAFLSHLPGESVVTVRLI